MNPEVAQQSPVAQPRVFTCLLRVGHLVPIAAIIVCMALSCVGLVVEHIQFEIPAGWVPVENTTTTTTATTKTSDTSSTSTNTTTTSATTTPTTSATTTTPVPTTTSP